jgi:uncharacterized membrane protein
MVQKPLSSRGEMTKTTLTPYWRWRHVSWPAIGLGVIVLLVSLELVSLSLIRFYGYNMRGFDLGNASQSIWSATQGQPLIVTTNGVPTSRLAGNVELFYLFLAPIYALFPSPATLLTIQALFFSAGVLPLYRLAHRRLTSARAAIVIVLIYLLYPVAQTAVLFEFHGDVLAIPFLLLAIEALDRQAWRSYAVWLALALSCKFYVAAPVAAIGAILWFRGQRRAGVATFLAGIGWGLFALLVLRPFFSPIEAGQVVGMTGGHIRFFDVTFGELGLMRLTASERVANALVVFAPALLLAWRAPGWLLPAGAIAIPVLISSGPGPIYDFRYHHYAVAVPFLLAAVIYGAEAFQARRPLGEQSRFPGYLFLTFLITCAFNTIFVDTPKNPFFYFSPPGSATGVDQSGYHISERDRLKRDWLAQIVPERVPLLTDRTMGLSLLNRENLYVVEQLTIPFEMVLADVDYVVLDSLFDFIWWTPAQSLADQGRNHLAIGRLMRNSSFQLTVVQDGLLFFERQGDGLLMQVETITIAHPLPLIASFGDQVGLIQANIQSLGDGRFLIECDWLALTGLNPAIPLIAVSYPEGITTSRFVHLPTLSLLPTARWAQDQIIRERFEIILPAGTLPGRYPLLTGWYQSNDPFFPLTDERSRIGEEILLGYLHIQ